MIVPRPSTTTVASGLSSSKFLLSSSESFIAMISARYARSADRGRDLAAAPLRWLELGAEGTALGQCYGLPVTRPVLVPLRRVIVIDCCDVVEVIGEGAAGIVRSEHTGQLAAPSDDGRADSMRGHVPQDGSERRREVDDIAILDHRVADLELAI